MNEECIDFLCRTGQAARTNGKAQEQCLCSRRDIGISQCVECPVQEVQYVEYDQKNEEDHDQTGHHLPDGAGPAGIKETVQKADEPPYKCHRMETRTGISNQGINQ